MCQDTAFLNIVQLFVLDLAKILVDPASMVVLVVRLELSIQKSGNCDSADWDGPLIEKTKLFGSICSS